MNFHKYHKNGITTKFVSILALFQKILISRLHGWSPNISQNCFHTAPCVGQPPYIGLGCPSTRPTRVHGIRHWCVICIHIAAAVCTHNGSYVELSCPIYTQDLPRPIKCGIAKPWYLALLACGLGINCQACIGQAPILYGPPGVILICVMYRGTLEGLICKYMYCNPVVQGMLFFIVDLTSRNKYYSFPTVLNLVILVNPG